MFNYKDIEDLLDIVRSGETNLCTYTSIVGTLRCILHTYPRAVARGMLQASQQRYYTRQQPVLSAEERMGNVAIEFGTKLIELSNTLKSNR